MPPKRKLKDSEIADLKLWIESGAPDPRDEVASTGGKSKAARADASFWSFQPPKAHAAARCQKHRLASRTTSTASSWPNWSRTASHPRRMPIRARCCAACPSISPACRPGCRQSDMQGARFVLREARRYDFWSFSPPAFAERFTSHWLDITRFAESSGGGRSLPFKDAWRFRDYVLESIRDNAPVTA
jgi:hypothetical protein